MPLSTGKTGRGITFEVGDGMSPEGFTAIANVTTINNSGRTAAEIDFTTLASDSGFREFRQGFKDAGTVSVAYHLDPTDATHQDILTRWLAADVFNWRINFIGAGWNKYLTGQGFIQNPGDIVIDVSNPIAGTATVRVTGPSAFVDA